MMAYEILRTEKMLHPDVMPLLMVLTDGAGNVSVGSLPPQQEAHTIAERIADDHIHTVVINMEHAAFDQGLAQALAEHLDGPCYTITDLRAESLYMTVRQAMDQPKPKEK
jgi:magnesium chelatase subunit D